MPFYEYQCQDCGEQHESLQKISDPPLIDCPACGKPGLKKQISAAGFRLKGAGWYETDFKSSNKRNLHDSKKPDSAKSTASETSKAPSSSKGSGSSSGSKAS